MLEFMKHQIVSVKKKPWEQTRRMGKWRYVLLHGVLLWGIPAAFFYIALQIALNWLIGEPLLHSEGFGHNIVSALVFVLIEFPLMGIPFGLWMWRRQERAYQKTLRGPLCPHCGYDLRGGQNPVPRVRVRNRSANA